jgi:nitrite reductase/ring-hydroxylating ferredoxin subunit
MEYPNSEPLTSYPDGRPESAQPRWRRDFPIDAPQDEYVARRDFTKFMVLTSAAFAFGQLWILLQNFFRRRRPALAFRRIARLADFPVGGALVFEYPEAHRPALLVRLDQARLVAYDQNCTHLSCPVIPHIEQGWLHCPCHEGSFDLATGRPLAGPPRRPLARIKLEIRDGWVYAAGIEERTI